MFSWATRGQDVPTGRNSAARTSAEAEALSDAVDPADYFGMAPGGDVDKFAVIGLTPVRAEHVDAPCVAEFPLVLACKVVRVAELWLHTHFFGERLGRGLTIGKALESKET